VIQQAAEDATGHFVRRASTIMARRRREGRDRCGARPEIRAVTGLIPDRRGRSWDGRSVRAAGRRLSSRVDSHPGPCRLATLFNGARRPAPPSDRTFGPVIGVRPQICRRRGRRRPDERVAASGGAGTPIDGDDRGLAGPTCEGRFTATFDTPPFRECGPDLLPEMMVKANSRAISSSVNPDHSVNPTLGSWAGRSLEVWSRPSSQWACLLSWPIHRRPPIHRIDPGL